MKRISPWLAAALAVYVLLRAAILWLAFDTVALTMYELYPTGTMPLMRGADHGLPLTDFYDNSAGFLLTAGMVTLLYELFGPYYLCIKLFAGLLGLATVWLVFVFLRQHTSERCAGLGAILYAVAPTTLTKYSLIATGNHFETIPFTLLAMLVFWRSHAKLLESPSHRPALFWLGFCAGLAVFIFLGAITTVAMLGLLHLGLRGWRRFLADVPTAGGGFLLGIGPLIVLNLTTDGRALGFLAAKFQGQGPGQPKAAFLTRLSDFYGEHLPAASTYKDWGPISGHFADGLFLCLFVAAWLVTAPRAIVDTWALARGVLTRGALALRAERPTASSLEALLCVPLIWYLPLTSIAYARSNLVIGGQAPELAHAGYRYLNTHYLFAGLLVALAARRLTLSRARFGKPAGVVLASLALLAGACNLGILREPSQARGVAAHYPGSAPKQIARTLLGKRQNHNLQEILRAAESFEPRTRSRVYEGLGFYRALRRGADDGDLTQENLPGLLEFMPTERRADAARGVGQFLANTFLVGREVSPQTFEIVEGWFDLPTPLERSMAEAAAEGLAMDWDLPLSFEVPLLLDTAVHYIHSAKARSKPSVARGAGMCAGRLLARRIPVEREVIARRGRNLDPDLRAHFGVGLGMGLADGWAQPRLLASDLEVLEPEFAVHVLHGFVRRVREVYGAEELKRTTERLATGLEPTHGELIRKLESGPDQWIRQTDPQPGK